MVRHVFRSELWEHSPGDPGSWHFLRVPPELTEEITLEADLHAGATCDVTLEVVP